MFCYALPNEGNMEDKDFLENALKQAFAHPLIRKESELLLFNTLAWADSFILLDLNEKVFAPIYIPFSYKKTTKWK